MTSKTGFHMSDILNETNFLSYLEFSLTSTACHFCKCCRHKFLLILFFLTTF